MEIVANRMAQSARKQSRDWFNSWTIGTALIAIAVILPIAAVFFIAMSPGDDIWSHLASTVLPDYIWTTLRLMVAVGLGTFIIGVGSAWLVSMYRFPGRGIFEWALLLPLAMPAYVIAYL